MTSNRSLDTVTAADFRNHRGNRFRLTAGSPDGDRPASVEVELVDVAEYPASAPGTFWAMRYES